MKYRHILVLMLVVIGPAALGAPPAVPQIPGITAKDQFPGACVDCHVKTPDGRDMRISALLAKWNGKADAKRLATMQGFSGKGMTLKGKHPPVGALKDVPASCMKCHSAASKAIPPLAPLLHGIHFGRGDQSEFVTHFQGSCTHCHKLNKTTGKWTLPSGMEK
jgi:hypothetical protein